MPPVEPVVKGTDSAMNLEELPVFGATSEKKEREEP